MDREVKHDLLVILDEALGIVVCGRRRAAIERGRSGGVGLEESWEVHHGLAELAIDGEAAGQRTVRSKGRDGLT